VKVLVKAGLEKKSKQILDLAEDLLLRKQGKNKITFEIARRITAENRALLKQFVKEGDVVKEKINHELIAGVKVIINNERQFDNSLKSKLQNIF
jgi:F0F1-type ATP synthase delta subunit